MQHPGNLKSEPEICFENGILRLEHIRPEQLPESAARLIRLDPRGNVYRAKACDYALFLLETLASGIRIQDKAKAFTPVEFQLQQVPLAQVLTRMINR